MEQVITITIAVVLGMEISKFLTGKRMRLRDEFIRAKRTFLFWLKTKLKK